MKKAIVISSVGLLSGCAMVWTRPNTTEAEFYQDRYQCEQQAAQMYPAIMTQRAVGASFQAPSRTDCSAYGNNISCQTAPGMSVQPNVVTEDANSLSRLMASDDCLKAKGYTRRSR